MQNPHPNFSAVESQPSIHPFEIRDTTVEDAPETAALLDSVARERRFLAMTTGFSIEDTQRFISLVRATNGVHLVATLAGSIIGWCDVMPHPFETMKHSGRLGMGIRKDHRGRGLGRRLLTLALQRADSAGLARVELQVLASNDPAIRLYDSFQFKLEGRFAAAWRLDGRSEDILLYARNNRP